MMAWIRKLIGCDPDARLMAYADAMADADTATEYEVARIAYLSYRRKIKEWEA